MVLTTRPVSTQFYAYCEEKALTCDNQIDCGHQRKPHNKFTYICSYSIKRYVYTKVSIAQLLNAKPYRSKPLPKIILLFPRCCILQSIHSFSVHFINLYHVNFISVFNLSTISQQIQKCFYFFSKTYILMRSIPTSLMLVLCKVTNVAGTDPGEVDGMASHPS